MKKAEREKQKEEKLHLIGEIIPDVNTLLNKAEKYRIAYNRSLKNYWENGKNKDEFDKECIEAGLFDFRFGQYGKNKPNWNYELIELDKQYRRLLKV